MCLSFCVLSLFVLWSVSFIILYLSHFPALCGNKSIHIFIPSPRAPTMLWPAGSLQNCHIHSFPFTFDDPTEHKQKISVQLSTTSAFCTWFEPPFKRKCTYSGRVFVYSRERKWSKMANIAESFPRLPSSHTTTTTWELIHSQSAFYWVQFPVRHSKEEEETKKQLERQKSAAKRLKMPKKRL